MDTVKLPYLKEDTSVSIELDSSYYQRLRLMIHHLLKDESQEDQLKYLSQALNVTEDNINSLNPTVIHLETLMLLLKAIEEKFEEKGLIDYKEFELPKTQD